MSKTEWLFLAGFTLLSIPIFRGGGHSRHDGISFWQYLSEAACVQQTHLPVDEALAQARQAYWELYGGLEG